MATETEIMKARFRAGTEVRTTAAVTTDARTGPGSVGEVVMTLNAVHLAMLVVRKPQDQRLTAPYERLTQSESGATAQRCEQRDE
jgi:hypothetical protein